jgi:hypothetical protein
VPGQPSAGCRTEANTPAHSGSIPSTPSKVADDAGGLLA